MPDATGGDEGSRKLMLYVYLVMLLVAIAAVSFLIVPRGSGMGACNSLLLTGNKYACLTNLALAQGNASICGEEQGQYADSCYSEVASKTGNVTLCSSVQNETSRTYCVFGIAVTSADYSACSGIPEPYASACEANIAVHAGNESMCAGIGNYTYNAECSSIIGIENALETGAGSYCGAASTSDNANITAYVLDNITSRNLGTSTLDSSLLSALLLPNTTITPRDLCYLELAGQTLNASLCNSVTPGYAQNTCTIESSQYPYNASTGGNYTQQLASCSSLGQYAGACADSIMLEHAVATENTTLCGQLPSSLADTCYELMASTYNNTSYCSYITNANESSACVQNS